MAAGQEKLTIESELTGGQQTAKGLDDIAAAEQKVAAETKATAAAAGSASETQESLNASESDFFGLLSLISPALGQYAQGLVQAAKISGDMAGKNLTMASTFGKVTSALKNNLGLVKLLGVVGLVAAAVGVLISQFNKMAEEAKRAEKAVRDQIAALDELNQKSKDNQADLETISASRREGPLTAEESRKQSQALQRAGDRTGAFTSQDARTKAVALAGGDATPQLIDRLTIAIAQFPSKVDIERLLATPSDRRSAAIDRTLSRLGDQLDTIQQREATQAAEVKDQAVNQARDGDGSTRAIVEFIKSQPGLGTKDVDAEALAKLVQAILGRTKDDSNRGVVGKLINPLDTLAEIITKITEGKAASKQQQFANRLSDDFENVDAGRIALAKDIARRLEQNRRSGTTTININQQGSTINGADAAMRLKRTVNGDRLAQTEAIE